MENQEEEGAFLGGGIKSFRLKSIRVKNRLSEKGAEKSPLL